MLESFCKKGVECGAIGNLQWTFIDAFSTFTLQSVLHIYIFTAPTSSCDVFWLYLHYRCKKHSLQAILENHAFECIFYSCWLISNITLPNFRLYTKPSYLKKHSTSLIIQMLSKNVQNFCIVSHSKILRAAPYFAHLSNFKVTTNTQISSKSQGSALAIFFEANFVDQ